MEKLEQESESKTLLAKLLDTQNTEITHLKSANNQSIENTTIDNHLQNSLTFHTQFS